jgi:ectoine hydroxylase-related dioxygenase (phytanoyl-CoA dioxygenase family)
MRRKVGVLMGANMLAAKLPTKHNPSLAGAQPTPWHQDAPDQPIDRNGYVGFWIALDRVTPDMGGMRFLDRSHHLGLLGSTGTDLYGLYPELQELTVTEPQDMKPGDATVHAMYTVHSAGLNLSDSPRWALLVSYIPDDALYTGGLPWSLATLAERARANLEPGDHFDARVCPKIYS